MENNNENTSYGERIFRLETQMSVVQHDLGEVKDRTKNAHHRIDETNDSINKFKQEFIEFRQEMREKFKEFNTKIENIGKNLAKKDKRDKVWKIAIIIVGAMAFAAFLGMFIQDVGIRNTIGDIALKLGIGAASML